MDKHQHSQKEVRVRIAPSPTGDPHVGTAYIGLFNYVFAKKHHGKFILRIEDTDQSRSTKQSEQMIFKSMRWLGLNWDEGPDVGGPYGPYRQSERTEIYRQSVQTLLDSGHAYRCFCTPERLEALRAAQRASAQPPGYDRTCRAMSVCDVEEKLQQNAPYVVRLKVPLEGNLSFVDELRGELSFSVAEVDDQVLLKSDGFPTYHLANVVDDHVMKITHVIRAEEWIASTPKHILLYRAFGWEIPKFYHMPLLRNADKSKISKRKNPVSLNYYERAGYLPEVMLNYLAMMGWTMPDGREKFSLADMIEHFSFERMSLGGPIFDLTKLTWLNGVYLRALEDKDFLQCLRHHLLSDDYLLKVLPLVKERVEKLEDFMSYSDFFFTGAVTLTKELLIPKGKTADDVKAIFEDLLVVFDGVLDWTHDTLDAGLRQLCQNKGWKTKELFMPVRIALTGKQATPPLFETLAVLGKECCRTRLREAIKLL